MEKTGFHILAFVTDQQTADFIELLVNRETATRGKLIDVFRNDNSGKGLIEFQDVAALVDQDLHISNGTLSVADFAPLRNAVTLTKLTLLGPEELNRVARDLAGEVEPLYQDESGNFTLLVGAVRSIDGNHQWQAYGLPYPRRLGVEHATPTESPYGRDGHHGERGLPFWTKTFLRERVFLKLFSGETIGALGARPELAYPHYRFPSCTQNPYPATQDGAGRVLEKDLTCTAIAKPDMLIVEVAASAEDYMARYFNCGGAITGLPHWTIAGSYASAIAAEARVAEIRREFSDMSAQVWRPVGKEKYWTVVIAACVPLNKAREVRDLAIRRWIARDSFVWRPRIPWVPAQP